MSGDPALLERLAGHLLRPVPDAVRRRARLHLLDWVGCVAAARRGPVAHALGRTDDAVSRAAWLGNVLEMDDVHRAAILHPGPVIWPTVLATPPASMDALLEAAIRGYEAMIAVGSPSDDRHYAFYHNTATAGLFGAAAASACAADCDAETIASAMGLAGSVAGGLWQMRHEACDGKQWHIAHAVETGRRAARFARLGLKGPRAMLEGPQGLHAATCITPRPMAFDAGWRIEQVSFKPWGACRHAHPAIDAALELKALGQLDGAIEVATYADAITFCNRPDPASVLDAKFSLHHAIAIVVDRGAPVLADFEPAAIATLTSVRARVTVREDAAFTARYPEHFGASVRTAKGEIALIDTRGDPERPLDREGIVTKARALMAWGGINDAGADAGIACALEADDPRALAAWLEEWL